MDLMHLIRRNHNIMMARLSLTSEMVFRKAPIAIESNVHVQVKKLVTANCNVHYSSVELNNYYKNDNHSTDLQRKSQI